MFLDLAVKGIEIFFHFLLDIRRELPGKIFQSIPAFIGFISLFGIATRNGMLLISHYNTLREEQGMGLRESIVHGALDCLNPILMTALSAALALIPLALRGGLPGNEIQSPMAKVILGGLLTSTFLNAFIIPIVYELMNRLKAGN